MDIIHRITVTWHALQRRAWSRTAPHRTAPHHPSTTEPTHHLPLPGVVDGVHQIASRPVEVLAPEPHDLHEDVPIDLRMHVAVPLDYPLLTQPHEEADGRVYLAVDYPGVEVVLGLERSRTYESVFEQRLVRRGGGPLGRVGGLLLVGAFRFIRRRCGYHIVFFANCRPTRRGDCQNNIAFVTSW